MGPVVFFSDADLHLFTNDRLGGNGLKRIYTGVSQKNETESNKMDIGKKTKILAIGPVIFFIFLPGDIEWRPGNEN